MRATLEALARRRAALLERSAAQRSALAAAAGGIRRATAAPVLLGVGVAASLLASSPELRGWAVRAWAAYALVRRLAGR